MSIDAQGWLDWAERVPGTPWKQNGGRNTVQGFVAHSAEGWEDYLRNYQKDTTRRASWTFSNLKDGRLLQHYPIYAQAWASGSTFPNNNFVPMEHEGKAGQVLTPAQVKTTAAVIAELAKAGGWKPERGVTLWEHRECTRWGSSPTACPSNRIPWDEVLTILAPPEPPPEKPTRRKRMPEWAIFGVEKGPAGDHYLFADGVFHLIPGDRAFEDLKALLYGDEPPEIAEYTWAWLNMLWPRVEDKKP